ncbi:TadE family protein [Salisediminibacterium beveridgei]|uniref:TadE-like domain-containing protein n=1 Tax=Salisediminibacterium beveridgei TaxID=632773 RepID=A0A1D7QXX7_9BACI|nr:TadE family protein [Salisediminibacterium beveridgei]AOM83863.1 hypothetical protein BBEV_2524 [Salisediminibacterium beveridgei]
MLKNEKGQSLAEFALVLPLLLLLIVGIVDFGRVLYTYSGLHFTVQETVRVGGFGYNDGEIAEFASDHFATGDGSQLSVSISPDESARKSGEYITITLGYDVDPITPFASQVFSGPIHLRADSTIRIE